MIWAPGWFILLQGLSTAYAVMDVLSVTLKDRQSGRCGGESHLQLVVEPRS